MCPFIGTINVVYGGLCVDVGSSSPCMNEYRCLPLLFCLLCFSLRSPISRRFGYVSNIVFKSLHYSRLSLL